MNSLPEPLGHEIGIIAAARDRVVCIESTCLSQQADYMVVDSGHTSMLFREDVAELVERFLREGRFSRYDSPGATSIQEGAGLAAELKCGRPRIGPIETSAESRKKQFTL